MYRGQKLAIEIGNCNIKMLFGSNRRILHAVSIETPENSIEDNRIVDIEKIYNVINDYILKNNINVKRVSFSLHGQDVVMRHIEIPIMEKKKLRDSVEWEANQHLPESGTNYYLDYEIIDRDNSSEKKVYKLLTAAVPKEKVDQYINLAERLNLKLDAIDIVANCAARVFYNAARNGKEFRSIGIVDIGSKSSSIIVLGNGKLFMEREVPFGMENLTREISRKLQIDMDDSFKYLVDDFNFDKVNEEHEMNKRIQGLFDNVSSIFLKVIQFYTTGKVQKNLDKIFVIGGGSILKGMQGYLSKYLSSPVYIVDSIEKIGIKMNFPQNSDLCFHIKTLGLLMRKSNAISELNLLPPYLKEKRQEKVNVKNYILAGIVVLSMICSLFYIPISGLSKVKSEEKEYKKLAEQSNGIAINMENQKIKMEVENYKQYIEKVDYLTQNKTIISNKVRELEQYVPEDIVFDSLTYGENVLTINATALNLDSISEFTANIQIAGSYKNVRVSNIRMENQDVTDSNSQNNQVYKFTINAVE